SWTAPVDARRLAPGENPSAVAAGQVRGLLQLCPGLDRRTALFVFDGGYDCIRLALGLAGAPASSSSGSAATGPSTATRRLVTGPAWDVPAATARSSPARIPPPGRRRMPCIRARTSSTAR
ncbi:hypothetical protein AABB02_40720, partial [Streptomyces rimosus]